MLAGRYSETTRILDNNTFPKQFLRSVAFLPEWFRQHGYRAVRVGKIEHRPLGQSISWDTAQSPTEDREVDSDAGASPRARRTAQRKGAAPVGIRWASRDLPDENFHDGKVATEAIAVLEQIRDERFFLAVGLNAPHLPFTAPETYFEMYAPGDIPLPEFPEGDLEDVPLAAAATRIPKKEQMPDERVRQARAAYYACVSFADAQVGRILEALDRLDLTDRTIVVLTSDHGFHLGEHDGLWRKMTLFEESARVPLLIAAPGHTKGTRVAAPVELVDLYPTLVELAGLEPPTGLQGRSLAPLLEDPTIDWSESAYSMLHYPDGTGMRTGHSIRTRRFRYTEWGQEGAEVELYDHRSDPGEFHNLADAPESQVTVKRLRKALKRAKRKALSGG